MRFDPHDPQPGIYESVPWGIYFITNAVNHSSLTGLRDGELKLGRHLDFGNFVHMAFLDRDAVLGLYKKGPCNDRRTAEWKEAKAAADEAGMILMTPAEWDMGIAMIRSVKHHKELSEIRAAKGMVEVVVIWDDPETGLRCKARIDKVVDRSLFDLKTTRVMGIGEFCSHAILEYDYCSQAAMYVDGFETATDTRAEGFYFGCISKEPPHDAWCFSIDDRDIEHGRVAYRKLLKWYKRTQIAQPVSAEQAVQTGDDHAHQ